ncbi:MAG: hypothetical protein JNJ40_08935 [Bacteroidia bacterium]|nr:hypothetical protein [Bacteroidia bacterium]
MKTIILSIAFTIALLSCKKDTACNKEEQNKEAISVKVKKEEVIYPIRDPYADDLSKQYKTYLNKRNGGC